MSVQAPDATGHTSDSGPGASGERSRVTCRVVADQGLNLFCFRLSKNGPARQPRACLRCQTHQTLTQVPQI